VENNNTGASVLDYPRFTKLKSKFNSYRQKVMGLGVTWLQRRSKKSAQNSSKARGENPYLHGIFGPVEEIEKHKFQVIGEIPQYLTGLLLRIGPNPTHVENQDAYHWFTGDGMLHALKIEQGQATWFKSRYIATDSIQKQKHQPVKAGFRRGPGDVVNTNALYHANKIWAAVEAGTLPARLDLNLNTEEHRLFNTDADLPFSAHPHKDNNTGHLHAICYDAMDIKHAYYEVIDEQGRLAYWTKIPVQHGPMIHDCAITAQDILIFDLPVTFSLKQLIKGNPLPYEWNEKHAARIGILPKYGRADEVQWIAIEPCFIFHAANAYRNEQQLIILDVVVHRSMFKKSHQGPFEQQNTQLERWIIDPKKHIVDRQVSDTQAQEFPRIDERYTGEQHRYIYSVSFDPLNMTKANHLICHDMHTQEKTTYAYGEQWVTGEVVFIPESVDTAEGEGYLLSYVHHVDKESSKVVILKAQGLMLQPQAEIILGVHVPLGFHGNWVDLS
jgi:carotenoid cleavage dioxygenase-like enzyme